MPRAKRRMEGDGVHALRAAEARICGQTWSRQALRWVGEVELGLFAGEEVPLVSW